MVLERPCFITSLSKYHQYTERGGEYGTARLRTLNEEMKDAAQKERNKAIKKGSYQGVPAIMVVVDGGWSKISHKHSTNAPSGVAIIVGQITRKLLYIVVRNKNCLTCIKAEGKGIHPIPHNCRNWYQSSQEPWSLT